MYINCSYTNNIKSTNVIIVYQNIFFFKIYMFKSLDLSVIIEE